MKESQIREHLKKGWIRTIITFEVVGKPKEHVTTALAAYIDNIKKDERIIILQEEREEPLELEDGMFSTFSETELLVKNLETFTWLCINFTPASIEVLEPSDLTIEAREITNWLNDLLSRVHEIGTNYRGLVNTNEHLTVALNELIMNAILLSLRHGQRTPAEIEFDTGIAADQLQPFFDHMVKKEKIARNGNAYAIVPQGAKPQLAAPAKESPAKKGKAKRK